MSDHFALESARPSEVFSARLRERAAVDHHARNRNIAFRHRRLPSLLIRPGPGAQVHPDRPSPSTDRDIDLPKPLALDTAKCYGRREDVVDWSV